MASKLSERDEDWTNTQQFVGRFFQRWALVERRIDQTISNILGLPTPADTIILANVNFRAKVHILRTAFSRMHEEDPMMRVANKTLARIVKMANRRNLLAHNLFYPMSDGSIEVTRVEARGKLEFPRVFWKPATCDHFIRVMGNISEDLDKIAEHVGGREAVIRALMARPTPRVRASSTLAALAGLDFQSPQDQSHQSSPAQPTSQETSPQNDPSPPGKPERD